MVCTSLSLASTSSLLVYLLYKKIKDYRMFGRHGTHYDNPTQGSFWLINLFVAGQFIYFELLIIRSRPRSRRYSCRSHRKSKFFNDWTWLHSSRIPHKLRRHCFSNLVFFNCVPYLRITCWRLQNQGLGFRKDWIRETEMGGLWRTLGLCISYWSDRSSDHSTVESWKRSLLYFLFSFLANEDDQVGPGWCWISGNYDLERLLLRYSRCSSSNATNCSLLVY